MTTKNIYTQHHENNEWLNKLAFYKDDITIIQKRLEEIASKNSGKEIMAQVEHFQNQLKIQRNTIDELHHNIAKNETMLEKNVAANETAVDHRKMQDHAGERGDIQSFEKNFNELRADFNRFAAQWM